MIIKIKSKYKVNTVWFDQKKLAECNDKYLYDSAAGRMQH
jgi:hypothetical protein